MSLTLSTKIVGSGVIVAVVLLVLVSLVVNLFDFVSHLSEVYANVIAGLIITIPVIVVWMFRQEIRNWIYQQNAPHLVVEKAKLDSEYLIQEMCVRIRDRSLVRRKANVVFVSVKNTKGRIARQIAAETNQGGYNTDMVFITPTGKTSLTVPVTSFIEDEAIKEDDASFVSAILNDVEREKSVLSSIAELAPPPKGRDKKFALCFALEGDEASGGRNRVWIPHITKIWRWMPCDFPLVVKLYCARNLSWYWCISCHW